MTETSTNAGKLGTFVADAMDRMERDLPDAHLGEIMLICEFQRERADGSRFTTVRTLCTDPREFVQLGLLRSATLARTSRRGLT